jgi:hypothetical protein
VISKLRYPDLQRFGDTQNGFCQYPDRRWSCHSKRTGGFAVGKIIFRSLHIDDHSFKINIGEISAENSGMEIAVNAPEGRLIVDGNKAAYFENGEQYEISRNASVNRVETSDGGELRYPNGAQISADKDGITIKRNTACQAAGHIH